MGIRVIKKSFHSALLLPARPDVCQECNYKHEPHLPHNAESIFYQAKYQIEHGRFPTWKDAMKHCSKKMKDIWTKGLREKGVKI